MIKNGDNVILKFSTYDGELSRYKGKAYIYESMENATKYCYHNEELVEYTPVKRGYWKLHNVEGEFFGIKTLVPWACNCSICGRDGGEETPYCPWCGAEMEVNINE